MENYIYGKNSVTETLLNSPKRVNKVFIQKGAGLDNRLKKIKEICFQNSIIVSYADFTKFYELFEVKKNNINLQSVVASVSPVKYYSLEEFLDIKKEGYKKIIVLDNVLDPNNFGSIIRTAACAGYDGIIIQNHRQAPVNATVEKISQGAVNCVPIVKVNSLQTTLKKLKDNDWWIIALDVNAENNYLDINYKDMNFALVLGNEGSGISKTLLNLSDYKVKLQSNFESLNVSCCCAVIVYETLRQINYLNDI